MSCRVKFHVVRSALALQYSACRILYVCIFIFADQVFTDPWLVPIRRLSKPSQSMDFGDVSETNGILDPSAYGFTCAEELWVEIDTNGREKKTLSDHVTRNALAGQNTDPTFFVMAYDPRQNSCFVFTTQHFEFNTKLLYFKLDI